MPLYNYDHYMRCQQEGVAPEAGRSTGRTTAAILNALSVSLNHPGQEVQVMDHALHGTQYTTDMAEHIRGLTEYYIRQLGFQKHTVCIRKGMAVYVICRLNIYIEPSIS